jgi:hypothetical protein
MLQLFATRAGAGGRLSDEEESRRAEELDLVWRAMAVDEQTELDTLIAENKALELAWRHETEAPLSYANPTTIKTYVDALERHILPALGDYYYDVITSQDVQQWIDGAIMRGWSTEKRHSRGKASKTASNKVRRAYSRYSILVWFRCFRTMTRDAMVALGFPAIPRCASRCRRRQSRTTKRTRSRLISSLRSWTRFATTTRTTSRWSFSSPTPGFVSVTPARCAGMTGTRKPA